MRWDELFADLESQVAAALDAELSAEVADRVRSENARAGLAERLAGAVGNEVRVTALGGAATTGTLRRTGPDWLLVAEGGGSDVVVPLASVGVVTGLTGAVAPPGGGGVVAARLGLGHVLRGIARDRLSVVVDLVDGTSTGGTVQRVGRDHLDLSVAGSPRMRDTGDEPRAGRGGGSWTVPMSAVAMLRRR